MASNLVQPSAVLPIHFFKIILKTNLERLKLPNKFTERYEGVLSNPVFLKPPDSAKWEVYWSKENGEVWFEKGWKQFAENYSLDYGYLVVFKYKGGSKFDVIVLDQSALEIDYPSCDNNLDHDQGDDVSVEILSETSAHQKARPKPPKFSSRSFKRMRNASLPVNAERNSNVQKSQKTMKHELKGLSTYQRTLLLNWPKLVKAQAVAQKFLTLTTNPFFTMDIKPCHLVEDARKQVPKFIDLKNKKLDVILQLGERLWPVRLVPNGVYDCLTLGWPLFATESKLQDGDICVFELIDREVPKLKVHVHKGFIL